MILYSSYIKLINKRTIAIIIQIIPDFLFFFIASSYVIPFFYFLGFTPNFGFITINNPQINITPIHTNIIINSPPYGFSIAYFYMETHWFLKPMVLS